MVAKAPGAAPPETSDLDRLSSAAADCHGCDLYRDATQTVFGGKRRIHKTPSRTEVVACRPWLEAELGAVRPELVIFLGATAAQSLLGKDFRVTQSRGEPIELPEFATTAVATVHPSSVLRAPNRDEAYQAFVADLVAARSAG